MAAFLLALGAPAARTAPAAEAGPAIGVTFPPEGYTVSVSSLHVAGWVSNPKAAFRVNGEPVKPHKAGGFLAYLPVSPGRFAFRCELDLPQGTTSFERTIVVLSPSQPVPPGPPRIAGEGSLPAEDVELRPGDLLEVRFRGTPGLQADFQAGKDKRRWPMPETQPGSGVYHGVYQVPASDQAETSEIRFTLRKDDDKTQAQAAAPGRLSIRSGPPLAAVVRSNGTAPLRGGPDGGHLVFPPAGTRLAVTGRSGTNLRVRLSASLDAWIAASAVQLLPAGSPPPKAVLGTVRVSSDQGMTAVHLGLTDTVPFTVESDPGLGSLRVTLFSTVGHTLWMIYDTEDPHVRQTQWRQEGTDTVSVTVQLSQGSRLWGYRAAWEPSGLKLELPHPPAVAQKGPVLAGRTIVLDPGHMPSSPGATGPKGTLEKDMNLAISQELGRLLAAEGARPVFTRVGDYEVGLHDRPRIASDMKGEAFVSIHNNNIPEGANPFKWPHGFSVFYYHPLSLDLAAAVHGSFLRRVPLPDEGLRFGNLLVARMTEMPAVLVEAAYMTYPEQEALLNAPAFRRRLARAVLEGLRGFFEAERARQARLPRPEAFPKPRLEPGEDSPAVEPASAKARPAKAGPVPAAGARPKRRKAGRGKTR